MEEFTPEHPGKMNFYLSVVDHRLRQPGDQPSIGLVLCKTKKHLTVEYALRDMGKPIGVSEWRKAHRGITSGAAAGESSDH